MPNTPRLAPEDQFPKDALAESKQPQPPADQGPWQGGVYTLFLATAADAITPWGKNVEKRDRELRDFWPSEPYLAGGVTTVGALRAALDWEIKGPSDAVNQSVTDMLMTAIAGDKIGWVEFVKRFTIDAMTQDNGAFIELIRDPGMDANSKFKAERAPVIGIAHLDSGACMRTGNTMTPVIYTDRDGERHKLQWYEVIPFAEFPSPIQKMNGVGYSSVTRALRLAQIMRSLLIYKDEKISGRNPKDLHIVGGVSQKSIEDAVKRAGENANNRGQARFQENVVLASLDPEKPVSLVTVELASLPDGYNLDQDMQWYISGLALNLGLDYQDLAPLPGGNIGSASQSMILNRKSSGRGPRNWMDTLTESFKNYGVIPRGTKLQFNDKNEQEELEKQEVRTKALEEAAIAARAKIFPRKYIAEDLVKRGIYPSLDGIPEEFWNDQNQIETNNPVGQRGGNTIREDARRVEGNREKPRVGDRLRKLLTPQKEEDTAIAPAAEGLARTIVTALTQWKPNISVNVEPTPVEVNVEPTPVKVNVAPPTVNFEMPKPKEQEVEIVRDQNGKIRSAKIKK